METNRWRIAGIPGNLSSSRALMCSYGSPSLSTGLSRIISPHTCICIVGVSQDKNAGVETAQSLHAQTSCYRAVWRTGQLEPTPAADRELLAVVSNVSSR